MVYLIHFDRPYKRVQHYIGYTADLDARLGAHTHNRGARLMQAVNAAGIGYKVVRVWLDGDRTFERRLKNRKNAKCLCPVCRAEAGGGTA